MRPSEAIVMAVERALRAPSVHNTQPWRWRVRSDTVELHADWNRHLVATDPDRRDVVLSCGAALHHLRVALAGAGLAVHVDRLPDPDDPGRLATVTVRPGPPDRADAALFPAITHRHTDRRRMGHEAVPARHLRALTEQARRAGALLLPTGSGERRQLLDRVLTEAVRRQRHVPGYAAELQIWTRRYTAGRDGVPAASRTAPHGGCDGDSPLRPFPGGQLSQPRAVAGQDPLDEAAELLVLATPHDTPLDWLRAGEATSAVLLAATVLGLATTPLSHAIEIDATRRAIQREVLHVPEYPQLVLRVGWPATGAAELPPTPRRDLRSVLLSS